MDIVNILEQLSETAYFNPSPLSSLDSTSEFGKAFEMNDSAAIKKMDIHYNSMREIANEVVVVLL